MSYVPKIGDRVRHAGWDDGSFIDVTYVSDTFVVGFNGQGHEVARTRVAYDWEHYVEPVVYPERWINVYPDGTALDHLSRHLAREAATSACIGVIHLHPDGTLEMEAP